jgi:hypothetical protein
VRHWPSHVRRPLSMYQQRWHQRQCDGHDQMRWAGRQTDGRRTVGACLEATVVLAESAVLARQLRQLGLNHRDRLALVLQVRAPLPQLPFQRVHARVQAQPLLRSARTVDRWCVSFPGTAGRFAWRRRLSRRTRAGTRRKSRGGRPGDSSIRTCHGTCVVLRHTAPGRAEDGNTKDTAGSEFRRASSSHPVVTVKLLSFLVAVFVADSLQRPARACHLSACLVRWDRGSCA